MRLETAVIITKGGCLSTGAMAAAISAGITQIGDRELFGVDAKVWSIVLGAYSVGCNALVAFLSSSFGKYQLEMMANGKDKPAPTPPAP